MSQCPRFVAQVRVRAVGNVQEILGLSQRGPGFSLDLGHILMQVSRVLIGLVGRSAVTEGYESQSLKFYKLHAVWISDLCVTRYHVSSGSAAGSMVLPPHLEGARF